MRTWKLQSSPAIAILTSVVLSSCSGGGGGTSGGDSQAQPPPPIVESYTFPAGDATAAPGTTAWDIVGVKTTLTGQFGSGGGNAYDTLRVDVTFTQDVTDALPAPGQPLSTGSQLGIQIGLDSDNNLQTGTFATCDPTNALRPVDYFSDAGNNPSRLLDGNYSIVGAGGAMNGSPATEAVTAVNGHVISQSFFLPSIGVFAGASPPIIGITVAAFNGNPTAHTDCVPRANLEVYTST